MQRVLAAAAQNPSLIPESFMGYMLDWLQISKLQIPIAQVPGYTKSVNAIVTQALAGQFTAQLNTVAGLAFSAGTPNTGAGPSLTLAAGSYVMLAGFDQAGVNSPSMVVSGGVTIVANTRGWLQTIGSPTTVTSTLSGTGGGAGGNISNPWLLALRFA